MPHEIWMQFDPTDHILETVLVVEIITEHIMPALGDLGIDALGAQLTEMLDIVSFGSKNCIGPRASKCCLDLGLVHRDQLACAAICFDPWHDGDVLCMGLLRIS